MQKGEAHLGLVRFRPTLGVPESPHCQPGLPPSQLGLQVGLSIVLISFIWSMTEGLSPSPDSQRIRLSCHTFQTVKDQDATSSRWTPGPLE